MVSHILYNLNANESLVISFTSKFITCFIDIHLQVLNFTLEMKSQSIAYSFRVSEHTY
jgi:hypothetical protein